MTIENQDIEQKSDVDDIVQESQSEEIENDDVEVTEITFDGDPLDDESDDTETSDNQESETDDKLESESEDDTPLIKRLRKVAKTKSKELQALKFELERFKKQPTHPTQSIAEPVLPSLADFDYDDDLYQNAVKKYTEDFVQYKAVQSQYESKRLSEQQRIAELQQGYIKQKSSLNIANFDNYENVVISNLDVPKQNLILKTEKPALVVVALARNPQLLSELSDLSNEEFAYKIAKIEQRIQVNTVKKPKTKPEQLLSNNAKAGISNDKSTEDALYKKCSETGDFTEYFNFINNRK